MIYPRNEGKRLDLISSFEHNRSELYMELSGLMRYLGPDRPVSVILREIDVSKSNELDNIIYEAMKEDRFERLKRSYAKKTRRRHRRR